MSTIKVSGRYAVQPDQTLSFENESAFRLVGKPDKPAPRLLIGGEVDVVSSVDEAQLAAVQVETSASGAGVTVSETGLLSIASTGAGDEVTGVALHAAGSIDNAGTIRASAAGDIYGAAYGVTSDAGGLHLHNAGLISVQSGGSAAAVTVDGSADIVNTGQITSFNDRAYGWSSAVEVSGSASFDNSGEVSARGKGEVIAVSLQGGVSLFVNSGTIVAQTTGEEVDATAVRVIGGANQTALTIENSGVIRATDGAISAGRVSGQGVVDVTIHNSGKISGGVGTGGGDDHVINDGAIEGSVGTGEGDDTVSFGSRGSITGGVYGGGGDDDVSGSRGGDVLYGDNYTRLNRSFGNDRVSGLGGDDNLAGQAGDDTLTGGAGADTLSGGDGSDLFVFSGAKDSVVGSVDLITDLRDDQDRIDLSGLDANKLVRGDQAFTLVDHLDGHAGEAALVYDAGADRTILALDTDGDGAADSAIRITGDHSGFTNFVL